MKKELVDYLNSLFALIRSCAEHGNLNRLSGAAMEEVKRYENNPDLLKEKNDGKPNN